MRAVALAWALLLASLGVVFIAMASGSPPPDLLFQADALYLPSLYRDVVLHGGRWVDWKLPPAPYFFPDLALAFGWNTVLRDFRLAIVAQAVSQVALLALGAQWVVREARGPVAAQAAAVLVPAALLLAFALGLFPLGIYLLVSAHHLGAAVATVLALAATLRLLRDGARATAALLALLSGAAAASDALFLLYFAAPMGVALLALNPSPHRRLGAAAAVVAPLVGWALPPLLYLRFRVPPPWSLHLDAAPATLERLWQTAGLLLVANLGLALTLRRRGRLELAFTLAMMAFTVLALAVTGAYEDAWSVRYLAGPLFVPPLVACLGVPERARWAAPVAVAAALGVAVARLHGPFERPVTRWSSPLVDCLDRLAPERRLSRGLADYWRAKPLSLMSRTGLEVVQVEPSGAPLHWINSRAWYPPGAPYDFIVTTGLEEAKLLERYGAPREKVVCATESVWLYGR
ncbi:MAG: hypothetical protein IPJ65_40410 [Archangiaceae bacterium]|nr:hypothetical protein [Archangiaceae bacterium]